jgi:Zn-dependent protease with chaperone function
VLGHEMGHYVLNHILKDVIETSLVIAVGFALIARGFERLRQRRPRWGIAAVGDVAGLPLIVLLLSVYFFDHPSGRTRIFSAMRWKAEHTAWQRSPAGAVR